MPNTTSASGRPEVILSANVSHYYYTALALQRAGWLKRYICAVALKCPDSWITRTLPSSWKRKLKSREIPGLEAGLTKSIWTAELVQRATPQLGLLSRERADWLNNHLFDILARRWVDSCDIFHFVSSVGLYSARKAKARGSLIICDVRQEYPDYQFRILEEEYSRLGLPYRPPGLLYDEKVKAEYALADYLIVPSHYAKRTFIQAGYDERSILVVPYGVDFSQLAASLPGRELLEDEQLTEPCRAPFRTIYVGQVVPRKGLRYLIEAFQALRPKDMELLIIGRVDRNMAPAMSKARSDDPRIRFLPQLPKNDLSYYYHSASVIVLPSLADSWGLVILEGLACGVPAIVTHNTGSAEAIQDGVNGFVVPIRNSEALGEKLLYLYEHPEVRAAMGLAARRSAMEFTWDRYGARLVDAYRLVLGSAPHRGPSAGSDAPMAMP